MKTVLKYGFLLFLLLAVSAPNVLAQKKKKKNKKKAKNEMVISSIDRFAIQKVFLEAERAKIIEDYPEAVRLFEKVVKMDPGNHASYYELAKIYFESSQFDAALASIMTAVKLDESNKWYLSLNAEIFAYRQRYADAAGIYAKLVETHPEDFDYYFDWAFMLIKADKYQEAIEVYNKYETKVGVEENVILQKQRLFIKQGKIEEAANELRKLIEAFPNELKYYHYLAELYLTNEKLDEMTVVYDELLKIDPDNPEALLNIAEMYRKKGDKEQYLHYVKLAFQNPDLAVEQKIRILYPYLQLISVDKERKEEGFTLVEILVEAHPEDARVHAIYGDLLNLDGQKENALDQYKESLAIDNSVYEVWQQIFFIYSDLQNFKALEETTSEALELFPNQALIYFFNGVSCNHLKKYQSAYEILETGKNLVTGNPLLKSQFYTNLGEVYNNMKNYAKSDSAFDSALALDADNAFTLNNYSYYLSLRKDKLEKAKKMSARSNELEKDNPSFQDTYAWIMYQIGEYNNAKEWMEKAIENTKEDNSTLFEHYGDILFKLGDTEKALEYWKKAEKSGSESELIGKKIADKQLYE